MRWDVVCVEWGGVRCLVGLVVGVVGGWSVWGGRSNGGVDVCGSVCGWVAYVDLRFHHRDHGFVDHLSS